MRSVKDSEVSYLSSIPACDLTTQSHTCGIPPGIRRKRENLWSWSWTLSWRATWVSTEPTERPRPRWFPGALRAALAFTLPAAGAPSPQPRGQVLMGPHPLNLGPELSLPEFRVQAKGPPPSSSVAFPSQVPALASGWLRAPRQDLPALSDAGVGGSKTLDVPDGPECLQQLGRMNITVGPRPAAILGSCSKESGQLLGGWRKSVRLLCG